VLLTGHGLQLTLLPLEAQSLGWSDSAIGLTGSFYYLGFIAGCLTIPRLIRRVGHIRTFTVCISIATVALLAASVSDMYALWLVFRMGTGWSMAGLYTTIESWLNDQAKNEQRGRVLAVYTIISLAALVLGQLLLQAESLSLEQLFPVAAMFIVAATLPVSLTSRPQPSVPAEVHFSWRTVFDASQVGLICSGLSGLVMGLLWSLGAVYVSGLTGDPGSGARFMAAVILGGLVVQFPVGRLSDAFDRRWIILGLGCLGVAGASLWLAVPFSGTWMYVSGILCGGAAMPMYSVSIAHANDNAEGRFLQIASGMLMANAIGAVAGPLLYGGTEFFALTYGFMGIVFSAFVVCVIWTAHRLRVHPVQREYFEPFQPLPKTVPEVFALDPRVQTPPTGAGTSPAPDGEPNR